MFDPWDVVAAHPWLVVRRDRLPEGVPGATTDGNVIWLDERLSQRERRCVLTHELVHVSAGHASCQPTAVERRVRWEAAHLLLEWPDLFRVLRGAHSLGEAAEELWVTDMVLGDRLESAKPDELEALQGLRRIVGEGVSW
ncbi:ImmA/IrrE family metallo-endopeptidase [Arthrobacter ginkgonis]